MTSRPMSGTEGLMGTHAATAARFGFNAPLDSHEANKRPLLDSLRYDHVNRQGRFTDTAKRNLIQNLFRVIQPWEHLWTIGPDPYNGRPGARAQTDFVNQDLYLDKHGNNMEQTVLEIQEAVEALRKKNAITLARRVRAGRRCGRVIPRSARYYSCKTCFREHTSTICLKCFNASDHQGHDVSFSLNYTFAAVCDCGEMDQYKNPSLHSCSDHPKADHSTSGERAQSFDPFETDAENVPEDFKKALFDVFSICLQYIMTTLQNAPGATDWGILPKTIEEMTSTYGENWSLVEPEKRKAGPWAVTIYADEKHNEPEMTRQVAHALGIDHDAAAAIIKQMDGLGRKTLLITVDPSRAFFTANMMQQIDVQTTIRHAYDNFNEETVATMIDWIADLCQCHVAGDPDLVTRILSQVLREDSVVDYQNSRMAPDLLAVQMGVRHGSNNPRSPIQTIVHPPTTVRLDWLWHLDNRLWRRPKWQMRIIYSRLANVHPEYLEFMTCRFGVNYISIVQNYLQGENESDTSLIQYLTYSLFSRGSALAKACRETGLLMNMLEVIEFHYRYAETVLDRPSEKEYRPELHLHVPIPPRERKEVDKEYRSRWLRSLHQSHKKGSYLLAQLRQYLLYDEVAEVVRQDHTLLRRILRITSLFDGIQTQRREVHEHLPFEVEWQKIFLLLGDLAQTIRRIGECFVGADPIVIISCLNLVAKQIIYDELLKTPTLDPTEWRAPTLAPMRGVLHKHNQPPSPLDEFVVIEHKPDGHAPADHFSFSNHTHYLFGWLVKALAHSVDFVNGQFQHSNFPELLSHCISVDVRLINDFGVDQANETLLLLVNRPLSKYVMLRQIRADQWRRNGRAMREQQSSYIDRARRDVTFDLEFYILQSALCMMRPDDFVKMAIKRFELETVFRETVDYGDAWVPGDNTAPNVRSTAMEDFLWMLIWLITDTDQIMHYSVEQLARANIIHDLAITSLTYNDLSGRLLDRMNRRVDIPAILSEVAVFKPATETAPGVYQLKPDYLKTEVNILWRHYSRNERNAVIANLLPQTFGDRPDTSINFEEWYLVPQTPKFPPAPHPFSNLGAMFHDGTAARVVHYIVANCMLMEDEAIWSVVRPEAHPHLDQVFDLVLYFAMMALQVDAEAFTAEAVSGSPIVCPYGPNGRNSLFQDMWYIAISKNPIWKPYMPRVSHILRAMSQQLPPEDSAQFLRIMRDKISQHSEVKPEPEDKGKDKAVARQKQLMAEFAKKQADFAALMAEGDDDEGMEDDVVHTDDNTSYGPCIVCQDPVSANALGGLLALFQPSRTIREVHHTQEDFEKSLAVPSSLDEATEHNTTTDYSGRDDDGPITRPEGHPSDNLRFGAYVSACGHLMHEECMDAFAEQTRIRHAQQVSRHQPENATRSEYMCPLCKSVGNILLPIDFAAEKVGAIEFRRDLTGHPIALLDHIRAVSHEGLRGVTDSSKVWDNHTDDGRLKCWLADEPGRWSSKKKRRQAMRSMNRMIDKFRALFRALSEQSEVIRHTHKPMYLPEDIVGYTISMLEIAQRGMPRSPGQQTVVDQLPETSRKLVKKMFEMMQLELDGEFGARTKNGYQDHKHCRTTLRICLFARFLPDWYRASSLTVPLLARDPLSMVIECAAIAPDLLHPVIVMSYYAEVCRALIHVTMMLRRVVMSWKIHEDPDMLDPFVTHGDPQADTASQIFGDFALIASNLFRNAAPFNDVNHVLQSVSKELLAKVMYMYTLPFLRRAAIVFHAVHGVYPNEQGPNLVTEGCEYGRLMSLMGIRSFVTVVQEPASVENAMMNRWFSHWAVAGRHVPPLELAGPYELLSLPECHDDMVNYYDGKECSSCRREPTHPGLCLFCGLFMCIGCDCCSAGEQGECNFHMRRCGGVVGMFLDIKRWNLLLLYAGTGSWMPMPYLDRHGDPDGGGQKRGHRLYLNKHRFEELRRNIWLNHSVPHIIARKLETVQDLGGWGSL